MEYITQENRNFYCRTCLAELKWRLSDVKEKYNTHKTGELAKLLQYFTAQTVTKNDIYPKYLCRECYRKVQALKKFRAMTLQSMQALKGVLAPSPIAVEVNYEWLSFQCNTRLAKNKQDIKNEHGEELDINEISAEQVLFTECKEEMSNEVLIVTDFTIEPVNQTQKMVPETDYLYESESNEKPPIEEMAINQDIEPPLDDCDKTEDIERPFDDCDKIEDIDCDDTENDILTDTTRESDNGDQTDDQSDELPDFDKQKISNIGGKYSCKVCHRRFRMQQNLDAHERTHQGLKPFQCDKCDRGYCKSTSLRVHIREKHSDTVLEIACPHEGCDKVFRKNASFKLHYRLKHRNDKPKLCTYICEDCGKVCKNIVLFREHRYKHGPIENYPYRCEQCGKYFISQRYYKDHLVRHTGIKNFECPECGMKKATRNELLTHIHNHTRKFSCSLCPKEYTSAESLKKHDLTIHKGIRTHACQFCNESFADSSTLKYHVMRHTGEMPFECNICKKRFRQRVSLRTHLRKQHEIDEKDKS